MVINWGDYNSIALRKIERLVHLQFAVVSFFKCKYIFEGGVGSGSLLI